MGITSSFAVLYVHTAEMLPTVSNYIKYKFKNEIIFLINIDRTECRCWSLGNCIAVWCHCGTIRTAIGKFILIIRELFLANANGTVNIYKIYNNTLYSAHIWMEFKFIWKQKYVIYWSTTKSYFYKQIVIYFVLQLIKKNKEV